MAERRSLGDWWFSIVRQLLLSIFAIPRARQIASRAYAVSVKNSRTKNSMRSFVCVGDGDGEFASRWGSTCRYASSSLRRVVWCGVTTSSGLDRKQGYVRMHRWSHRITSRGSTGISLVDIDSAPRHDSYIEYMWVVPIPYSHGYPCI